MSTEENITETLDTKKKTKKTKVKKAKIKKLGSSEPKKSQNLLPIILGLIISIACFFGLLIVQDYFSEEITYKEVLVAKTDIPAHEIITEENAQKYFASKKINILDVTNAHLFDYSSLIGKKSIVPIVKTEAIFDKDFEEYLLFIDNVENPVEVSIGFPAASNAAGGKVRAGDFVNITMYYASDNGTSMNSNGTNIITNAEDAVLANKNNHEGYKYVFQGVFIKEALDSNGAVIPPTNTTSTTAMVIVVIEEEKELLLNDLLTSGASMRVSKVVNKDAYIEKIKDNTLENSIDNSNEIDTDDSENTEDTDINNETEETLENSFVEISEEDALSISEQNDENIDVVDSEGILNE